MQKFNAPRSRRRMGADAAFAKAMARAEFGRFYTDDAREQEVARSMARGRSDKARQERPKRQARPQPEPPAGATSQKTAPWRPPRVRERRSEMAAAMARIAAGAKQRSENGSG